MGYIKQALALHTDRGLPNPRLADIDYIKIMSNAVKKYESVPKRQEMISDGMFHFIARLTKRASQDSFVRAVTDWIILGAYTGFRKSEWCNDHPVDFETITDPQWGTRATSLAIIAEDFSFATCTGARLDDIHNITDSNITFTTLCIRKQKNNDNGQLLTYQRRPTSTWMCPTQASINIVRRAVRLGTPPGHPSAVYLDASSGQRRQITSSEFATFLRHVAHKTFNIPNRHPDLRSWSCHSLRVTAANLLHRAGFSDSFIKNRLRWRSDTFLMYLRNTFHTASQHTNAITLGLDPPSKDDSRPLELHEHVLSTTTS